MRLPEWENNVFNFRPNDQAIILDISIPEEIAKIAPDDQILELIDHHPGYEEYWRKRISDKAIIEKIGAVATSIFEWWGECWDYDKMTPQIAKLLLGAILDNTLNFNAKIATERDHKAAKKLAQIAGVGLADFTAWYFTAVSKTIASNLENSLLQDCKTVTLPADQSKFAFYQLTLWDTDEIINYTNKILQIAGKKRSDFLVSIINISARQNFLLTNSKTLAKYFTNLLDLKKQGDWLVSGQLYLRKEIIAKMLG